MSNCIKVGEIVTGGRFPYLYEVLEVNPEMPCGWGDRKWRLKLRICFYCNAMLFGVMLTYIVKSAMNLPLGL